VNMLCISRAIKKMTKYPFRKSETWCSTVQREALINNPLKVRLKVKVILEFTGQTDFSFCTTFFCLKSQGVNEKLVHNIPQYVRERALNLHVHEMFWGATVLWTVTFCYFTISFVIKLAILCAISNNITEYFNFLDYGRLWTRYITTR
jgi:hypothetical protein